MIAIDFVAGTHGNYLEFVLNKLLLGSTIKEKDPFNDIGASHKKGLNYDDNQIVKARHFFSGHYDIQTYQKVISITFDHGDLLPLMTVSLLRAGDYNIDINNLQNNTYQKLSEDFSNGHYLTLRDNIYNSYKEFLYNAKGQPIKNCPRHILREFFKFGFKNIGINGFICELNKMSYATEQKVYYFNYSSFYDTDTFINELESIKEFFNLQYQNINLINELHEQFLLRQPQRHYKKYCEEIIKSVVEGQSTDIENLTLFQESYINGRLENIFEVEMPFEQPAYFKNTQDILEYIKDAKNESGADKSS